MKMYARILFVGLTLWMGLSQSAVASPLTEPLEKVKLPSSDWTWGKPDKDPNTTRILYPTKTGQAVNVRAHTYEVPVSAKVFLDQVRGNLMSREDYQGAEIRLMTTQVVDGVTWDVFEVKRKDEINQEIWGRKPSSNVVFMIIYTGAGSYFKEYYDQFKGIMSSLSK